MAEHKNNQEVIRIRSRLTELEAEQASLEARLSDLLQPHRPQSSQNSTAENSCEWRQSDKQATGRLDTS
jgi:BMFP domain-containing protein YqiC